MSPWQSVLLSLSWLVWASLWLLERREKKLERVRGDRWRGEVLRLQKVVEALIRGDRDEARRLLHDIATTSEKV